MEYVIYFVITIGILVFIHEFGHFAAAKLSGMQTDIFSIGFGKRLFGWNKITGFTFGSLPEDVDLQGHTDYRVALLPLGGYVKIAGMIDESFDTEFVDKEPQPNEFRAKPTYKKLFVITAGVLMNLLLTVMIFWGANYFEGRQVPLTTKVGRITTDMAAYDYGFRTGDLIEKVNGKKVEDWEQITKAIFVDGLDKGARVEIRRGERDTILYVPSKALTGDSKLFLPFGETAAMVTDVVKNSPAEEAGIKAGDIITAIEGEPVGSSEDVVKLISSNKEKKIPIVLVRAEDTLTVYANTGLEGKIGIGIADVYNGPVKLVKYGFFESFEKAFKDIAKYTELTFVMFKNVISGKVAFGKVFGGPIKIAQFAAKSADSGWSSFLFFLAMLSLSLAIINIIPFPGLDGGHFVIIVIEGILRRELPVKAKIAIQNIGFILLLILMAFILYSDIINL
jgi:regulator of sigma E protease